MADAFAEPINGKIRDELLAIEVLDTLLQSVVTAEDHRPLDNTYRSHSSHGNRTSNVFR